MTQARSEFDHLDWAKGDGMLPAIVQHAHDGRVLMLGYMDRDALARTLECGQVTFFSRSKQSLWTKGESSGHVLELVRMYADCDADTLLVQALPHGPTCHLGSDSCFGDASAPALAFAGQLDTLVATRKVERPQGSYTTRLFEGGTRRIAQKVGEEGVETALAGVAQDDDALVGEAADLFYHLLVLLHDRGLDFSDVVKRLRERHAN
ncbi:bifunctional phosphoribosyl-AMP cyclohydrolase/phosphoribosyl-ATP diphosphatase HisIE [Oleiagrimonas sp.]|uniref:bifunctional phosphoribosyl-AMP cyclohydrolase/phosphoribosyl-ATP diphosphatase HisIE n=1 Tax=Oleiagrimonas sp. TaxID=2010330 RepID=UPI0026248002|nr:bifunctional phosphoribosyl-AMP cyclohydrolase/phosphoribosyl-ATP diphosphatase HisIE [Oleiagrimonas sp.]MDA3912709.1 bifunctional phosphoribosyl-AMP cyclohydrolase/phosphoribosyl-ATP diphosphatase HisIE [Oleiagrimonas sp.]